MPKAYYSEQTMENIARRVLNAFDGRLYTGKPCAIPIENIIEWHGLIMEFQYIRKNGRILGQTIFDTGLEAVYDMERMEYTLFPVKAGTILIDASLCEEEASTGRLRFTEAQSWPTGSYIRACIPALVRVPHFGLPSERLTWRSRPTCWAQPF